MEVNNKILSVARRICSLREDMGISIEEMAQKVDLTPAEYSSYEAGALDFTFTFIYKCAQVFGVEINELMEGETPKMTGYTVTKAGEGNPIVRRQGFVYNRLASNFKGKLIEPFHVRIPYDEEALTRPRHLGSHKGQEMDIVLKGTVKIILGEHEEILHEGDCIYYDSSTPHDEIALGGEDCEIYAIIMSPRAGEEAAYEQCVLEKAMTNVDMAEISNPVSDRFITTETDVHGVLSSVKFHDTEHFNFGFDVVDAIAEKNPEKLAMLHISKNMEENRFTFADMKKYSNMTANYFESLGIKRGDRVMLVLKRHYQFWFSILALHKIGAIVIPATNQLLCHDFEYRFNAAGVSAIIATADDNVPENVDAAQASSPTLKTKVIVGAKREGWCDFIEEMPKFSDAYPRKEDAPGGEDPMLMFFTSGTTGYPKLACHSYTYALGHFVTAKFWHNVTPDGLHFTISDTGWGKALWGKLYGQWLCEAATFTYDFDRFDATKILPMFKKYNITTFCAPPTMFRMFIREDLSVYDLSSLRYATTAGEALNPEVFQIFYKSTGLRLHEGFGQTETTLTIGNFVGAPLRIGSMGRKNPQYDVKILLPDGSEAKVGETGEICISTENGNPMGLFIGYYEDPERTHEAWHDNVYHTGDTAWMDEDGYFWYVGRVDDLIKSSGYRIGPFEIENVIMELPYVLECAVVPAPDPVRGQVVRAVIVLTKGTEASDELKKEIQTYVKQHTAPYKYPRIVDFIDEMPKTISGKIIRTALK